MPLSAKRPRPTATQTAGTKKNGANGRVADMRQINYLRECLYYPQIIKQINLKLAQCQQPIVTEVDFSASEDRELFKRMARQVEQGNIVTIAEMCDSLDDDILLSRVQYLQQTSPTPESELGRLPEKLALSILHWRLEKVKRHLAELQLLFRETNRNDQPELADLYSQQIRESHLVIQSLNRAAETMIAIKDF